MQVIINIPDNLPQAVIQQQITEFEEKLKQQAKRITPIENKTKEQNYQAIMNIAKKYSSLPTFDYRTPDAILGYE